MKATVTVGVPVAGMQNSSWWTYIMNHLLDWQAHDAIDIVNVVSAGSAMPGVSKNMVLTAAHMNGNNDYLTSANRNALANSLETDWLYFIDQDTVPDAQALPELLAHNYPFVSGVYYHRNDPHAPLVYKRQRNGLYNMVTNFEIGTIFNGTEYASGLGCALIHRSVFDAIREQYAMFTRPNGTRFLVHQDDIHRESVPARLRGQEAVYTNGLEYHYVAPLGIPDTALDERFHYPFFDMEHGRTEDLGFCEKAARVGFPVRIDTSITCKHWHLFPITEEHFSTLRDNMLIAGAAMPGEEIA